MMSIPRLDTDPGGFGQGSTSTGPTKIVIELAYDSGVAVGDRGFASRGDATQQLDDLISPVCDRIASRFDTNAFRRATRMRQRVKELGELPVADRSPFAMAGFVEVDLTTSQDHTRTLERLNQLETVWKAVPAPAISLAGNTAPANVVTGRSRERRNFEPAQGYLHSVPTGINVGPAWAIPGGRGHNVTVCDIEGNWNRGHVDLPRGIPLIGGRPITGEQWRSHGTAVLGQLVAQPGRSGVHGICSDATAVVQSHHYANGENVARAMASATERLGPGDVILLEVQALGPTLRYVTPLWWDDVYSAALNALDQGIHVVAAAGNGSVDFDSSAFDGSNLQKSTDILMVGAGVPPTNSYDVDRSYDQIGPPRTAMPFSNHGSGVVLQGWGWHVTTLGFGDAQGGQESRWLTLRFAGTSSAAPMVAGSVACLQGICRQLFAQTLSATQISELLVSTATPQGAGPQIGDLPNLGAAAEKLQLEGP